MLTDLCTNRNCEGFLAGQTIGLTFFGEAKGYMETLFDNQKNCFGCGACAAACPAKAISMEPDQEGFLYPHIVADLCIECGRCTAVCPAKVRMPRREGSFFAVRCKEEQVLQRSTSGGAFTLLAQEVIAQDGIVCGAVFDESFSVRHVLSQDITPMRKSKYVQSDLSGCYTAIQEALDQGCMVLFTGTPCQCHAMRQYFPESHERLLLASLICRGVQSPGLWHDYTIWLRRGGSLQAYDFRDKRCGNDGHAVSYTVNGRETVVSMAEDRFSRIYNLCLTCRPSCYTCPYTRADNDFDFTLGDFWGVERSCPRFADGRGTSLVIAHGQRGESFVSQLERYAWVVPCEPDLCMQPALAAPAREPFLRKFLFRDYAKKNEEGCCDIPFILKKYGAGYTAD